MAGCAVAGTQQAVLRGRVGGLAVAAHGCPLPKAVSGGSERRAEGGRLDGGMGHGGGGGDGAWRWGEM